MAEASIILGILFWIAFLIPIILSIIFSIRYKSWLKSALVFILGAILSVILGDGMDKLCFSITEEVGCHFAALPFLQLGIILAGLGVISLVVGLIRKYLKK